MLSESGAATKASDSDSDDEDQLFRAAADTGVEERDAVSDQVVQAIHGRGNKAAEAAAMHFLAARDAVSSSQQQMKHLRSAINSVRKGHKNWWQTTDDAVVRFGPKPKDSPVCQLTPSLCVRCVSHSDGTVVLSGGAPARCSRCVHQNA